MFSPSLRICLSPLFQSVCLSRGPHGESPCGKALGWGHLKAKILIWVTFFFFFFSSSAVGVAFVDFKKLKKSSKANRTRRRPWEFSNSILFFFFFFTILNILACTHRYYMSHMIENMDKPGLFKQRQVAQICIKTHWLTMIYSPWFSLLTGMNTVVHIRTLWTRS